MTLSVQMDQATFCGLVPVMHNWAKQRCCGPIFPPSPVTLCHPSWDPPKVRHTSRTPSPIFIRPSTKKQTKATCTDSLNCSRWLLSGACVRGSFVWKVLSIPPSVRIHLLQQNVKHHFKFHVSYV